MTKHILFLSLLFSSSVFATVQTDRDYAGVLKELQQIANQYPQSTEIVNLGNSDSGQDILAIKIGHGSVANLVVAAHHGNEYGSTEVALSFANDVAKNPLSNQTIFVIPVLNIGGYEKRARDEFAGSMWHDPNRNYPGPCGTEGPFTLKSSQALADFIDRENIVNSATIHTYYPAVVYPWGLTSHDLGTPYMDTFNALASAATYLSRYETGNSTDVIYPANGTFEDYAYWKHGVWSLLFEVGNSHWPDKKSLEETVRVNVPGLRRMFETAPLARAENHDFKGDCAWNLLHLDRHDE